MLRILQKLLLTLLMVSYTSKASAMFIQPDWFDPADPQVGTNRYAYSQNDPVNNHDPGGNYCVPCGVPVVEAIKAAGIAALAALGVSVVANNPPPIGHNGGPQLEPHGEQEESTINPELHEGQQGKHQPDHNNYDPSRSPIAEGVDPGELVAGAAEGEYPQVGSGARGDPIFDFGKTIGTDAKTGKPTPYGTVHSGKKGSHVVPANPDKVREQIEKDREEQEASESDDNDEDS